MKRLAVAIAGLALCALGGSGLASAASPHSYPGPRLVFDPTSVGLLIPQDGHTWQLRVFEVGTGTPIGTLTGTNPPTFELTVNYPPYCGEINAAAYRSTAEDGGSFRFIIGHDHVIDTCPPPTTTTTTTTTTSTTVPPTSTTTTAAPPVAVAPTTTTTLPPQPPLPAPGTPAAAALASPATVAPTGELAFTGAPVVPLGELGAGLVLLGLPLMLRRRRA